MRMDMEIGMVVHSTHMNRKTRLLCDGRSSTQRHVQSALHAPVLKSLQQTYMAAHSDPESLLKVRRGWDLFLDSTPSATRIPDGFVCPPLPTAPLWAACLMISSPSPPPTPNRDEVC
eukprot:Rmarinus@m.26099